MPKAPTDIRSLARSHSETALNTLRGIMREKKAPASARVAACIALLDRGYGKPTQPLGGDKESPLVIETVKRLIVDDARNQDSESIQAPS